MNHLHVEGVHIRVTGLTARQGEQLGERVGVLLGERLAQEEVHTHPGPVHVRIEARDHQTVEQLAHQIVTAIRATL